MHRRFISLLFVLGLISFFNAQVNYDSLHKAASLQTDVRKKMELYWKGSSDRKLTVSDYELLERALIKLGDETGMRAYAMAIVATIYNHHKDLDKTLEYCNLAIKHGLQEKDTVSLGYAYFRTALCLYEQEDFDKALDGMRASARYYSQLRMEHPYNKLRDVYNYTGSIFKDQHALDSALYYHQRTLAIAIRLKDRKQEAFSYNNIGLVYNKMGELEKALEFYALSAAIKKELKDYKSLCGTIINKAAVLQKAGRTQEALKHYEEGIRMAEAYKRGNFLLVGVKDLAELQLKLKDFKNAAFNYEKFNRLKDSINGEKEAKKLRELAAKYESERKDAEILKSREDIRNQEMIIKKQKHFNYAVMAGLVLAFISIGVVFKSYRQSKKFSHSLSEQKILIEEKNKEITDSIRYAKRIQESLLTSHEVFRQNCRDHFILFRPKDIVSGDFYWALKTPEGLMVMCGDCTGHGVPGAFMSLLGISYLTEIVQQQCIYQPSRVFDELRKKVIATLNQKEEGGKDGMDATMIKMKGMQLDFACSHNPLWLIRNGEVLKFRADKTPIGMGAEESGSFTAQSVQLEPGDAIYMFSDGYADQFGGPAGKKFKIKQLEAKMREIAAFTMDEQKQKLEDYFAEWKGSLDQVDDICIIGIRV